jgi:hypothetical protein
MPERIRYDKAPNADVYDIIWDDEKTRNAFIGVIIIPWWEMQDPPSRVEVHSWALQMPIMTLEIDEVDAFCEWLARLFCYLYRR